MVASINASTSAGVVTTADTSGILQLQTASTAALTIDASQNVGIGTASPDLKLSVAGGMNLRNSSRAGAFEIDSSGNLWAGTATTAGNIYLETGHSTTGLPSTGTARVTVNQYGLGLGATPSSGTGITFPATTNVSSDANTLDDYEEGTWTPAFAFGGGTTGMTYSSRAGKYTKIGNMVYAGFTISLSAKGSSTGAATFTGLPFTSSVAQESRMGTCASYYSNFNTAFGILLFMEASNTTSNLRYMSAGTVTDMNDTHFQNASSMYGVFIYQAA